MSAKPANMNPVLDREARTYTYPQRVTWADCDPAKIVYTGRLPWFCLEAIDAFWGEVTGQDWFHANIDRDVGTPFVHLSMDFKSPVTPRHVLFCTVRLIKLGNSSVRFSVTGHQDGVECFRGEFVEVFVAAAAHEKIDMPDDIRTQLEVMLSVE